MFRSRLASQGSVVPVGHRRDIEGLRAVAVIAVLLFHFGVPGFDGGYVGVDVFFVISGFLITSLLIRERSTTGGISLSAFYARRIRRLLPISAVVLVVTAVAAALWLEPTRLSDLARDIMAASLFSVNFVLANRGTDYLGAAAQPSAVQHYWSLAIEEQFYLVWPGLIALVTIGARNVRRRVAATMVVLIALSFTASIALTSGHPSWSYFGLHTRAWELGLGALVAAVVRSAHNTSQRVRSVIGWAGLAGVGLSVVTFGSVVAFPGWAALLPVVAAACVLFAGDDVLDGPTRVLGARPLQWVGQRSYSLYLWHWPALIIAQAAVGNDFHLQAKIGVLLIVVGVADLGYRFIENPVRRSPRLLTNSVLTLRLGAALIVVGALVGLALTSYQPDITTGVLAVSPTLIDSTSTTGATVATTATSTAATTTIAQAPAGPSAPFSMAAAAPLQPIVDAVSVNVAPDNLKPPLLNAKQDTSVIYTNDCHQYYKSSVKKDCVFGDPNGSVTVALWGDSHAAQWFVALDAIGKQRGWKVLSLTQGGCPFLDVLTYNRDANATFNHCVPWRQSARNFMKQSGANVVFLAQYYGLLKSTDRQPITVASWQQQLGPLIDSLRADGIEPIMLGDTPDPPSAVPACVSSHRRAVNDCAPKAASDRVVGIDDAVRSITLASGTGFVEPRRWLCANDVCPVIVGDLLVYRDESHVSNTFMRSLTPVIDQVVGAAVDTIDSR